MASKAALEFMFDKMSGFGARLGEVANEHLLDLNEEIELVNLIVARGKDSLLSASEWRSFALRCAGGYTYLHKQKGV